MRLTTKNILGVNVTTAPKLQILEEIRKYLKKVPSTKAQGRQKSKVPLVIFTPNPEIIVYAQKDTNFKRIVNSAQINIPDGWGMVWALKKLFGVTIEKLSGVDLMLNLCQLAAGKGFRVGLIGGREGVALKALECLQRQFSNLKGWAMDGPELEISKIKNQKSKIKNQKRLKTTSGVAALSEVEGHDSPEVKESNDESWGLGISREKMSEIIEKIIKEQTDILFVALGFPKQEYFISIIHHSLSIIHYHRPLVLMVVGGSFDYLAGKIPRAPAWMRERGLEWLFRLMRQPWRLLRQIRGAEFFYRVATHHFSPA